MCMSGCAIPISPFACSCFNGFGTRVLCGRGFSDPGYRLTWLSHCHSALWVFCMDTQLQMFSYEGKHYSVSELLNPMLRLQVPSTEDEVGLEYEPRSYTRPLS